MTNPVGEESWLAYLDESTRHISDLEQRVNVIELYKRAVVAEPVSLRIWLSYCNYFWSLWSDSQSGDVGWTEDEQLMGRELFSFGAALDLWQQGYEAIKYRLNDSHILWNRWISLELELLGKTRTPEGIKRVTHLYRDRLVIPHMTWEDTSQRYFSFLSEYNRGGWEESMNDITARSHDTKRVITARDPFELRLQQAARADDAEAEKTIMTEYLEWEMRQSRRNTGNPELGIDLCRGLYDRALTGQFFAEEAMWHEYVIFLSTSYTEANAPERLLDVIRRAVQHCPWSGQLWNRYILCAEEARLDFSEVESIKHAATSENQLYKSGMESMLEMYVAWCGFLKRTAMDPSASDEDVDVADVGLSAALEDVEVVGKRLYGKEFQGDPKFRLERIYIQYLTEKKGAVEAARARWNKLAGIQIYADSYDFWSRYYMWEMFIFSSAELANRRHTPSSAHSGLPIPTLATAVLHRAATRLTVDWPERILEVYLQHCNDYEPSSSMRKAMDLIHKLRKMVEARRLNEQKEKEAAYASYYGLGESRQADATVDANADGDRETDVAGAQKRKRERHQSHSPDENETVSKRQRSMPDAGQSQPDEAKRDRENTTVVVSNLPVEVTQTKVRQYFKEFGHINSIPALAREEGGQSAVAMIEFSSPDEAQSALLRDGKFFGQSQIRVESGRDLTVYVANFPPTADEKYMRHLFRDCGEILSIRWPSLKVNVHRRFCYVSFRDRQGSARAVSKDGTMISGTYKLLAKYSDPGHKKNREGPVAEGREIRISSLNTAATEEGIQGVFSKYGNVTRINIPRTMSGKGKGFAFVVFESKDEADRAVSELNNTKFMNQILQVEISKEFRVKPSSNYNANRSGASSSRSMADDLDEKSNKNHGNDKDAISTPGDDGGGTTTPTPSDIASRTISLLGLPDTVNDARVRSLVEPMGAVVKLILQPSHGGARIEFADSTAAGKASLQLDNMEYEGRKLRVGSLEDLRHAKAERTSDRIVYGGNKPQKQRDHHAADAPARALMPQQPVRRPVLRRPGPKRGLGFVAQKPVAAAAAAAAQGDAAQNDRDAPNGESEAAVPRDATSTKRTNAEFKTLLLTGSFSKGEDKDTN